MLQGPMVADSFSFCFKFYVSPAGHWTVDLETSSGWDNHHKQPLMSGHSSRWLTSDEVNRLRDIAFGSIDVGIHHIADPTS